jgi:hypothetical protein
MAGHETPRIPITFLCHESTGRDLTAFAQGLEDMIPLDSAIISGKDNTSVGQTVKRRGRQRCHVVTSGMLQSNEESRASFLDAK